MPQTNRAILRPHLSRVSRIARLASRQAMLGLTEVVGSSMVTAIRGFSGAGVGSGRAEAAASVVKVRRNSRRCMRALYIGGNTVGNQKKHPRLKGETWGTRKTSSRSMRAAGERMRKADPSAQRQGLGMTA